MTTAQTLACLLTLLLSARPALPDDQVLGIEALYRIDRLPAFKRSVAVGSISSYDRSGGNNDGFSGQYSYIRKEGDGLVLLDLTGPGILSRIWTPTPTDDPLEFYFDGEATPRITVPFREMFTGGSEPFVRPLVGFGAGGFYSYVPLPFQKSCKVVARAERIQFYQINYAIYPDGPPFIAFVCELPAAGRYRVSIEAAQGPQQGQVQLFMDEAAVGEAVDLYAETRALGPPRPLGTLELEEGPNTILLKIVGKHAGAKNLRTDLRAILCERVN